MSQLRDARRQRTAFTLIELLVVIAIIAIISTLALLVVPRFSERQKTALGASQLQGWLAIAKQRAYRDKVPSGLQFLSDSSDPDYPGRYVRTLRYVVQPDDFTVPSFRPNVTPRNSNAVGFSPDPSTPPVNLVPVCNAGDFLVLAGEVYRITGVAADTLSITPPLTQDVFRQDKWRIVRHPRAIEGEADLQLPADVVVDLNPEWPNPPNGSSAVPRNTQLVPDNLLVLFSPAGGVVKEGTGPDGKYIFYVRDSSLDSTLDGSPTLITVYLRTGAIAAHPVNPNGPNRYSFTQDGLSSGL